jgi:acetyl esterase
MIDRGGALRLTDRLYANFLSTVATRVVRASAVSLTDRTVAAPERILVPTRHGDVPCYVTRPAPDAPLARGGGTPPVHLNFHGGAFLVDSTRQDEHLVRGLAGEAGVVVVNVHYSAGTKTRYPQAHEECFDVLNWVRGAGEQHGWDSQRLSVGGTSAGGNLALGVLELVREARDRQVSAAVLIVPTVDQTIPPEAHVAPPGSTDAPFVSPALVRMVHGYYFADASRRGEPLASPGRGGSEQFSALPPLLVFGAEKDSLRPAIERYVGAVRAAGVDVDYRCMPGVDHGYTNQPGKDGVPALRETAELIAQFLVRRLS